MHHEYVALSIFNQQVRPIAETDNWEFRLCDEGTKLVEICRGGHGDDHPSTSTDAVRGA
jgi:hypothetical protein